MIVFFSFFFLFTMHTAVVGALRVMGPVVIDSRSKMVS